MECILFYVRATEKYKENKRSNLEEIRRSLVATLNTLVRKNFIIKGKKNLFITLKLIGKTKTTTTITSIFFK